jgi:acetyl-CoA carboxylase biotin carboxyl carrier protein
VDLTNDDVAEILALLDSLPYDELDLRTPRFRLTLRRAPGGGWTEESQIRTEPATVTSLPDGAPVASAATPEPRPSDASSSPSHRNSDISEMSDWSADGVAGGDGERAGLVAVPAPLPGTFYRAPRPGAAPFVEAGDEVAEDTVVAIVETMKLMNSVHAGTRGRVAEICLDNGELAVQGVTLMWIEPIS